MGNLENEKRPFQLGATGKGVSLNSWRLIGVFIIITWIAYALRLINIDAFSFWTDEALTPLRSSYPLAQIFRNDIIIEGVVTKDTHPPFYYLIIHFTRSLFGETDFAYRYPSVLAGVLLLPIMYQFGRRLHNFKLGLLVLLLVTINPLQIWYADEARMYTVYVLLIASASYILWRALSGAPLLRYLFLYLLLAGLAFYTHYTAVFLIAFQSLFWVWLLWKNGLQKVIIGVGFLGLLIAIPLVPYTIPRLFSGNEANFFLVSPWVMLIDVLRFFALGVTVNFEQLPIQVLIAVNTMLLILGVYAARRWPCRLFLLSYLFAIVLGLMLGSYLFKPMYQGVRHIMGGSPALIILVAWGILFAWEQAQQKMKPRFVWYLVASIGFLVVLSASLLSLYNFYNHPEIYAKDDFRSLIAQMETLAGENDVIVYNNAIHLPLHEHYRTRSDVSVVAIPYYPSLARDTAVPDLLNLVEVYDRIWFMPDSPADHRDDEGLVRQWLNENLVQVGRIDAHSLNTIVESLIYSTQDVQTESLPETANLLDLQWDSVPTLHGIQIENAPQITSPALWMALFWDGGSSPSGAVLRFTLQDETGQNWVDLLEEIQTDQSVPWPKTGLSRQPYQLNLPLGMPPGQYSLFIQPVDSESLTPLGDVQHLSDVEINSGAEYASLNWPRARQIQFENGLKLLGWEASDEQVRPGHNLPLTLYWQADQPLDVAELRYELAVVDAGGMIIRTQESAPGVDWLQTIPTDTIIREQTGIYIRPQTKPGKYQIQWRLLADDEVIVGRPSYQPWYAESVILGEIDVAPWPLQTELPTDVETSGAVFGPIQLHGYRKELTTDSDRLDFDLVWRAQAPVQEEFLLFAHLVDVDGNILAQVDRVPGDGLRATTGWREAEVISDTVSLELPSDMIAGEYRLFVGFYDPGSGLRLPATVDGESQPNDQVQVFLVDIP